jgi:hypothetical protein
MAAAWPPCAFEVDRTYYFGASGAGAGAGSAGAGAGSGAADGAGASVVVGAVAVGVGADGTKYQISSKASTTAATIVSVLDSIVSSP